MITKALEKRLAEAATSDQQVTVLTGAGISAESGIPTFRGPEGYWTVGSAVYQPQEMATLEMFRKNPEAVWAWYLYRLGICEKASPNNGHQALVGMETLLKARFTLVTQNVDDLHHRAGSTLKRMHEIHGNIFRVRCAQGCTLDLMPVPEGLPTMPKKEGLSADAVESLHCNNCGGWMRPHVLWFDEVYDEAYFHYHTVIEVALRTDMLIIVGTSGATHLPNQMVWTAVRQGASLIDINIEASPFSSQAQNSPGGGFIQMPSGHALPEILSVMENANMR